MTLSRTNTNDTTCQTLSSLQPDIGEKKLPTNVTQARKPLNVSRTLCKSFSTKELSKRFTNVLLPTPEGPQRTSSEPARKVKVLSVF